ncbi:c-type cytochrome [Methylocapsa palsarum]|uniref:Cytochrome c n=1 Tax=Methylocapsa palsarum TaxID=1612308 RepID=A0A1I4A0G5_9HYPH|nr:cytochrome c family protein [Methylocapsa palsarum]SFK49832.1 cytochrome c [Methylocapsa palsarum]
MSAFEMNKFAGAFLASLLLAISLAIASDVIFSHHKLVKAGYALPAAEPVAEASAAPAAAEPLPVRLAKADPGKGEANTKACQSCHSFDKGGAAKAGPPLYGVVNRAIGSVAGFAYSDSIKSKGGAWSPDALDQFLSGPKTYASGTKMTYAGEKDPDKRADIIVYLESLSENPKPVSSK